MTEFDIMQAIGEADEDLLDPVLAEIKPKGVKRSVKIAIVAAAALLLLIGAAIAKSSDGFLSELFGESYDIIGDYVMMEPVSVENEYARITVESAFSDGFNAYVVYSVERLDGGTLEGMNLEMEINPLYSYGAVPMGHQSMGWEFITGNETPQKEWNAWMWSGKVGLEGVDLRLLGVRDQLTGESTDFGEVRMSVPLIECPVKLAPNGGEPMGRDVYTDIILSPLGFQMAAWPNLAPLTSDENGESQRNRDYTTVDCTVALLQDDGTELDISDRISRRPDGDKDSIKCMFEAPMDIDKVDALLINGRRYELKYGQPNRLRTSSSTDRYQMQREYLFGSHELSHPQIKAESEGVSLETESIWTDGSTVELSVYIEAISEVGGAYTYLDNGTMGITAKNKKGQLVAVSAQVVPICAIEDERVLCGYLIHIGGEAETLIMNLKGAEIEVPLDMKKLNKLSQGEPYEPVPSEPPAEPTFDIYQEQYDDLFGYRTPDKVDITADNGEYSITIEYLWQTVTKSKGRFLAMVCCEQLDGEKYEYGRARKEIEIGVVYDSEFRAADSVDGGFKSGWVDGSLRYVTAEIDYDFPTGERDAVRFIWTPPSGARIVIDIPIE